MSDEKRKSPRWLETAFGVSVSFTSTHMLITVINKDPSDPVMWVCGLWAFASGMLVLFFSHAHGRAITGWRKAQDGWREANSLMLQQHEAHSRFATRVKRVFNQLDVTHGKAERWPTP